METAQICLAVNDKQADAGGFYRMAVRNAVGGPRQGISAGTGGLPGRGAGAVGVVGLGGSWTCRGDQLWPAGLCVLAAALFAACMPRWMGRLRYRQHLTMTQGAASRRTVFYPQYLEIETNGVVQGRYWYADVKKVIKTKHLMLLKFANQVYCAVRRDGFSQGRNEEVLRCVEAERRTRPRA